MRALFGFLFLLSGLAAAELKLLPPYDDAAREYSGLAWHGDRLLLLPQYPDGFLPVLRRSQLRQAIRSGAPLDPAEIPFDDSRVRAELKGYEGYEAIAVSGSRFFGLVEARTLFGKMRGYLVAGSIGDDGIVVDRMRELPLPLQIANYAFEAVTVTPERVFVFYEANGIAAAPFAYALSHDLEKMEKFPVAPVDYRITDISALHDSKAWAVNSYWIGDREKLKAQKRENFSRLLELEWHREGIRPTGRTIMLRRGGPFYNWEGVAKLDEGFLVITDTHPGSVIAYIDK